jgi:hypothetical protein
VIISTALLYFLGKILEVEMTPELLKLPPRQIAYNYLHPLHGCTVVYTAGLT